MNFGFIDPDRYSVYREQMSGKDGGDLCGSYDTNRMERSIGAR